MKTSVLSSHLHPGVRRVRWDVSADKALGERLGRLRVVVALAALLGTGLCGALARASAGQMALSAVPAPANAEASSPATLQQLLDLSAGQLARCDIALLNLLCAEGLPGAHGLDCKQCLVTLDKWAAHVKSETERHLYRFKAHPAEFDNSEGYFRMLMMAVVVYEDFGVRYNPARVTRPDATGADDHFFADSRDIFLHGLLSPALNSQPSLLRTAATEGEATLNQRQRLGTCSSMPVLYIALGRRLGYPLKLVTTKAHLFLRWESATERFDLEATGKGMNRYDDEHFRRWPYPVTEEEIKTDGYLKSLTPAEALAVFLSLRGHCLREAGRTQEAASAVPGRCEAGPVVQGLPPASCRHSGQFARRGPNQRPGTTTPGTSSSRQPLNTEP